MAPAPAGFRRNHHTLSGSANVGAGLARHHGTGVRGCGRKWLGQTENEMTLGVFLASAGLFLVVVGVSGRMAIWILERFSR